MGEKETRVEWHTSQVLLEITLKDYKKSGGLEAGWIKTFAQYKSRL